MPFFSRRRSRKSGRRSRTKSFSASIPLLRWLGPSSTVAGLAGIVMMWASGRIDLSMLDHASPDRWANATESAGEDSAGSVSPHGGSTDSTTSVASADTSPKLSSEGTSLETGTGATTPSVQLPRTSAQTVSSRSQTNPTSRRSQRSGQPILATKPQDAIRIATFNIRSFGPSKTRNALVMQRLAEVISHFDVVAIQEVHNKTVDPIQALTDTLASMGGAYASTVSESIGGTAKGNRRAYQEAYAYVFDTQRITLIPHSDYLVQDPTERIPREPMVASFQVKLHPADRRVPFRFTLINAHTSPSGVEKESTDNEMNVLDDVFASVRSYEYEVRNEEDHILLGDLNVDTQGFRELGQIPNLRSAAGDTKTNTRGDKTYDHIVFDTVYTSEFTGRAGVFDLRSQFGISLDEALELSDHQPVWAEFSIVEHPFPQAPHVATRTGRQSR